MSSSSHYIDDLNKNTAILNEFLLSISEKEASFKASPNQWSILECAEHLWIVDKAICGIFNGRSNETKGDPEEKINLVKSYFHDFSKQFTASNQISPQGIFKDIPNVIEAIKINREEMLEEENLNAECLDFSHPIFGTMTKLEWVYFSIIHTERHLQQMKNTLKNQA